MARLIWDEMKDRYFETGVSNAVLYPPLASGVTSETSKFGKGVVWNGVTAVTPSPTGAEPSPFYADNIKYLEILSNEDFNCTIEAYTVPDEFAVCDGTASVGDEGAAIFIHGQERKRFGFAWRSEIGDGENGIGSNYKIHVVYNAMAKPSEQSYQTIAESPEPSTFSYECSTMPEAIADIGGKKVKPCAHFEFDSRKISPENMKKLEDKLFGSTSTEAELPKVDDLLKIFSAGAEAHAG